jgi:hypothetical protein
VVPNALVPIIIVVAIIAIVRGDASMRDLIKIGKTIGIITAIGLTILYVPAWLYESILNRDAPTWLTYITTIPVLILAFITHLVLTVPPKPRPDQSATIPHDH